jgi:hypothetical protein
MWAACSTDGVIAADGRPAVVTGEKTIETDPVASISEALTARPVFAAKSKAPLPQLAVFFRVNPSTCVVAAGRVSAT